MGTSLLKSTSVYAWLVWSGRYRWEMAHWKHQVDKYPIKYLSALTTKTNSSRQQTEKVHTMRFECRNVQPFQIPYDPQGTAIFGCVMFRKIKNVFRKILIDAPSPKAIESLKARKSEKPPNGNVPSLTPRYAEIPTRSRSAKWAVRQTMG